MLDERDLDIVAALQEDARATYADIGRRAGLSASSVHERVRKLERTGAIRGYRAIIDPDASQVRTTTYAAVASSATAALANTKRRLVKTSTLPC